MGKLNKEKMTRRKFVKGLAGAAVCCACFSMKDLANAAGNRGNTKKAPGKEHLVAVCGTYCGACPMYINNHLDDKEKVKGMFERYAGRPMNMDLKDFVCDGCLSGGHLAVHCKNCKMRLCAQEKPGVTRCSDCPDFPCSLMKDFASDGKLHHAELLQNLRQLHEMGIKKWTEFEDKRWNCTHCGLPLSWYDSECSGCGKARSELLFPLK